MSEIYLINDTETTGFPSSTAPARDPKQARVMQVAYILADETGRHLAEVCMLVRPDGWRAGAGAIATHGITDEICEKFGVSSKHAFETFEELATRATTYVSHNTKFDLQMFAIEAAAHGLKMPKFKKTICTMNDTGQGVGHRSLAKVYEHFTGKPMPEDAHDAGVDTRACRDVLFAWLEKTGKKPKVEIVAQGVVEEDFSDLV